MRRNKIIEIIFSLSLIILFSSCSDKDPSKKYVIKNITQPCKTLLVASDTSKEPTTIFVHIMGTINGECTFELKGKKQKYLSVNLKDTIDYIYRSEWYDTQITLEYQPKSGIVGDSIIVKYRIW